MYVLTCDEGVQCLLHSHMYHVSNSADFWTTHTISTITEGSVAGGTDLCLRVIFTELLEEHL